jgi:hypothetical protein
MKKVILRTPMRTRSNSFSDALFRTHFFVRTFSDVLFRTHFLVRTFSDALFKAWTVAPSVGLLGLDTQITILDTLNENGNFTDS